MLAQSRGSNGSICRRLSSQQRQATLIHASRHRRRLICASQHRLVLYTKPECALCDGIKACGACSCLPRPTPTISTWPGLHIFNLRSLLLVCMRHMPACRTSSMDYWTGRSSCHRRSAAQRWRLVLGSPCGLPPSPCPATALEWPSLASTCLLPRQLWPSRPTPAVCCPMPSLRPAHSSLTGKPLAAGWWSAARASAPCGQMPPRKRSDHPGFFLRRSCPEGACACSLPCLCLPLPCRARTAEPLCAAGSMPFASPPTPHVLARTRQPSASA